MDSAQSPFETRRLTRVEGFLNVGLFSLLWLAGLFFAVVAVGGLVETLPLLARGGVDPFVAASVVAAVGWVVLFGTLIRNSIKPHGGILAAIHFSLANLFGIETLECDELGGPSLSLRCVLKWRARCFPLWSIQPSEIEMIAWDRGLLFLYLRAADSEPGRSDSSLWTVDPSWSSRAVFMTPDPSETESRAMEFIELLRALEVEFVAGKRANVLVRRRAVSS